MEIIRNWAFSLCCASIAGGILNFILPKNNVQKTFKTVFCVFFLCILLSPISEIDFKKFDFLYFNSSDSENDFKENDFSLFSAEYIKNELIASTKNILEREQVSAENINVKINISEEGSINITEFSLVLTNSEKADYIAEKIYAETGINPNLSISGEE